MRLKTVAADRWRRAMAELRAIAIRRGVAPADADDVVQDALEKAVRRIETLADTDRFEPWIRRIAANAATDRVRHLNRQPVSVEIDPDRLPADGASEDPGLLSFAQCVTPFVNRLSPSDTEVLTLKDLSGHSVEDIARRIGLTVPGTKARLRRARGRLKESLVACCSDLQQSGERTDPDICCAPVSSEDTSPVSTGIDPHPGKKRLPADDGRALAIAAGVRRV